MPEYRTPALCCPWAQCLEKCWVVLASGGGHPQSFWHILCVRTFSLWRKYCLEVKGCMLFLYCSLLSPRRSQPVVSINPALTGAKHSFSPEKKMRSMGTKSQSFLAFRVGAGNVQRCVWYGSGSAGVTVRVRCGLAMGCPSYFPALVSP